MPGRRDVEVNMGRHTASTLTLIVVAGLGVSACSSAEDDSSNSRDAVIQQTDAQSGESDPDPGIAPNSDSEIGAGDAAEAPAAAVDAVDAVPPSLLAPGQALAIRAGVTLTTSDIDRAVDDTIAAVQRNGASVFTADINIGDDLEDGSVDGSGFFVVQVPPEDLELLIADLDATVGQVTGRTQDSTDVTDQLVDLDIRIGVERDVIDRFQALLADASEFQDIVEIERVISERTIALEQLLASQRNLENRVEFSTLTIELRYLAPSAETAETADGDDGLGDAWRSGWDVFVGALFTIGLGLAVAAPFLVTAIILLGMVWLFGFRRRRRQTTDRPALSDRDESVLAGPSPTE